MQKIKTILLVDDDTICSWLNKLLLKEMQIAEHIVCLYDGQSALDYLKKSLAAGPGATDTVCPDLIFLDLNMPDLDGFQVLQQLQQLPEGQTLISERVIMVSTSMHPLDIEQASQFEVYNYLVKPLTETKVKAAILQFMEMYLQRLQSQPKAAGSRETKDRKSLRRPAGDAIKQHSNTRKKN